MSLVENLVLAVQDGDEEQATDLAQQALNQGIPVLDIVSALTSGLRAVGDQFARQEVFLPEMLLASHAMQAAMKVLEPRMEESAMVQEKKGVVVMGTVEGDVHEIGKDIATTLLKAAGFEVHDLGADVNALTFVRKAEEVRADIIGASALMTTTMPGQKDIVEILKAKGIRQKYHVIFGGAPVTAEWVAEAGADSWGENAALAVEVLERVMASKKER
jgi:trimethylamine corrinoid protein